MPLRVAVNLLWLAPGRVGGSEEYLVRQLTGLPGHDLEVVLYCTPRFAEAHPPITSRFATVTLPFRRDWRGARIVAEHSWLAVRGRSADVVHHGGGTAPMIGTRPIVLTVHDLQYRRFPQYFGPVRRAYLERVVPLSVRRSAIVTTPSEYVRGTVIEAFGVAADRVVVVPHGVPEPDHPDAVAVADARERLGIGGRPYLVYPAITHPHKNHRVLVAMLRSLDADIALVLLGGEGAAESDLRRDVAASGESHRIVRTGRVSAHDRDVVIAGASAMVFPSEYEGFGAPLVEAMALGTPIVCSATPAVREVVGDAGVVVPAGDADAWAAGVGEALRLRDELVDRGHRRRSLYTLEASGSALAESYRRAAHS
jgi:alpha-1,3-rhamnosyl/mannosyltransferase